MAVFKGLINKSRDWGLRRKILVSMVMPLALLGLTIFLVTRMILFKTLKEQFQDKGLNHARSIASNSLVDILTQNTARLKKLVANEKKLDKDTAYVFIMDHSGRILAHTFPAGFPTGLIKANSLSPEAVFKIRLLDTRMGLIYDIVAPILLDKGLVGQVRVGVFWNNILRTIMAVNLMILGATLLVVILGVFLALQISSFITRPISELAEATRSIQKGDFSAKIDIKTKDEIGLLVEAFNRNAEFLGFQTEEFCVPITPTSSRKKHFTWRIFSESGLSRKLRALARRDSLVGVSEGQWFFRRFSFGGFS